VRILANDARKESSRGWEMGSGGFETYARDWTITTSRIWSVGLLVCFCSIPMQYYYSCYCKHFMDITHIQAPKTNPSSPILFCGRLMMRSEKLGVVQETMRGSHVIAYDQGR
jgi:hypothetical protein